MHSTNHTEVPVDCNLHLLISATLLYQLGVLEYFWNSFSQKSPAEKLPWLVSLSYDRSPKSLYCNIIIDQRQLWNHSHRSVSKCHLNAVLVDHCNGLLIRSSEKSTINTHPWSVICKDCVLIVVDLILKSIYSLQVLIWATQILITITQCRGQRSSRFQVRGSCRHWCGCCRRPSPPPPASQGSYVPYTARIACGANAIVEYEKFWKLRNDMEISDKYKWKCLLVTTMKRSDLHLRFIWRVSKVCKPGGHRRSCAFSISSVTICRKKIIRISIGLGKLTYVNRAPRFLKWPLYHCL